MSRGGTRRKQQGRWVGKQEQREAMAAGVGDGSSPTRVPVGPRQRWLASLRTRRGAAVALTSTHQLARAAIASMREVVVSMQEIEGGRWLEAEREAGVWGPRVSY